MQRNVISIHAPRGGSDSTTVWIVRQLIIFQSTLPVGGATELKSPYKGGRDISIHAPRGGSDSCAGSDSEI